MKTNLHYIALLLFLIANACSSENAFDCIKKTGDIKTILVNDFSEFNDLVIHDDITLELIEDESEYFEVIYGENLIPKIKFVSDKDSLLIYNENFCGWTRDYQKPLVRWHTTKELVNIKSLSSGNIFNNDTLGVNLQIEAKDISNKVELTVNSENILLISNSISNFKVIGHCQRLTVRSYFSDSHFELGQLQCSRVNVLQRGYNDIIVNPSDSLVGSIENAGRVMYYGSPGIKMVVENGGELIKLEK
ncbi:hypothetical protein GCM10011506_17020 [Marivirga lumbricoides]|uniref:Putative auto-transporter adhesin head GIN domain-containing protein n=1 Tax=Marivirga lumbricoides TaxID=1046115 RepID=A0ABQ1LZM7_9BACT|nr:hypothetical protein GCM10011506_17020 [Marivirga lumbricoides]